MSKYCERDSCAQPSVEGELDWLEDGIHILFSVAWRAIATLVGALIGVVAGDPPQ